MKKIGFIGAYDKTDLLLNIAKILTTMNNRTLIIDSTINQKAKYVVPAIDPTISYITSFEDIDVAIGFNDLDEIKRYTGTSTDLPYDVEFQFQVAAKLLGKREVDGVARHLDRKSVV